jgi:hypothetical protein
VNLKNARCNNKDIVHLLDKYNKNYKMHDTYYNKFIWTGLA